jgi:transketolase
MRNKFAQCMTQFAAEDESLCLLYADIGNRLFDKLKGIAPERTINAGIAEANMATMASGMAQMGFRPFIYTITPFTTARNFEQIKIDLAYANQPVTIVGTGSGLSYANLGPTHHSFEDIALMRVLPDMHIVCPADSLELEALFGQLLTLDGPCYFRIGKKNEPLNYSELPDLTLGKAHVLSTGEDIAILSTGTSLPIATAVRDRLMQRDISAEVASIHTVKPLDEVYLRDIANNKLLVTIEEHSVIGGFGAAVADFYLEQATISQHGSMPRLLRCGLPDSFIDKLHDPQSARESVGLTPENIESKILCALENST